MLFQQTLHPQRGSPIQKPQITIKSRANIALDKIYTQMATDASPRGEQSQRFSTNMAENMIFEDIFLSL